MPGKRPTRLPIIIVTGASGFIGRHFLKAFNCDFYIYAIARKSQKEAGVPLHKNINWLRVDIGEQSMVERSMNEIAENGGADYLLHLAGYYDFDNKDSPEYERTNVNGTRYILENTDKLNIKRFLFASSIIITEFFKNGRIVDEKSPPDANFPYAVSKRKCEEMIKQYSKHFPCSIIRLAAIFSDWCEYGPLYNFLTTWLSPHWISKIIAGEGKTSIPYLHVRNLNSMIYSIIRNSDHLLQYDTYIASPDGCTTQINLYQIAVGYNFGKSIKPIYLPKWLAYIGVSLMNILGHLTHNQPFEKPWMIKYVDTTLEVDTSYTRAQLLWKPIPRFHVERRLLFLIEYMKSNPVEWHRINQEAILKRRIFSPNLKIYETMVTLENNIILGIMEEIYSKDNEERFLKYKKLSTKEIENRIRVVYSMLKTAVRTEDRVHGLSYASDLARKRFKEDMEAHEVIDAIQFISNNVIQILLDQNELKDMKQRIYDEIMMTTQLIVDEIEDSFDRLMGIE